MQQLYVAVVHKEADSDFRAHFPDFPGVVATAPTLAEAIKKAAQARRPIPVAERAGDALAFR